MSQVYSVNTLGGNWSNPYLTDRLRQVSQPEFRIRQFADVREGIGLKRGDTFLFDKRQNVSSQGGTLSETATIPETNFVTNQGTGVVTEYGNAVGYTAKLNSLGQFDVPSNTEQALKDDMVKVLESAVGDVFAATEYIGVCETTASFAITTNGTATATATADLTGSNVRTAVDFFKRNLVPKFDGQNFVMVVSVNARSGMFDDVAAGGWSDITKYTDLAINNLLNGEVGTYYGARFVEETGFLSNIVGNGATHGQSILIGGDNIIESVVEPEQIRVKESADFGRDMGLAWYFLGGWTRVWDFAVDGEQHVMFITSA